MTLFVLGQRVPVQRGLREAALPYLADRYEATHEKVLDSTGTLFLEKVTGRRSMPIVSRVGGRLPVRDHARNVIAAVSIAGRSHRLDLARLAPAVRTAAFSLSREMTRFRR
jgi:DNA-binding IclR family transcriptional regulator